MSADKLRTLLKALLKSRGKTSFLTKLTPDSVILDVGCGNDFPLIVKNILPLCHYTGIDVGEYNQTRPDLADKYIITNPNTFASEISKFKSCFHAVVSSHNIEHCNDRESTIRAMLNAVKPGGRIYISFPCEGSVDFPNRRGTLNYFDDITH